jgi:lipoprotein-releasing system ATP-binding protein
MGDEPTGNLDSKNSQIVFDIFRDIARQGRQTIIAVTHDEDFAANCDRVLELSDGRLVK